MKSKFIILFILTIILIQNSHAQNFDKVKMDSMMTIIASKNKAMLSIALSQNGKIVYNRAIGYREVNNQHQTPATTHTRYRIGSITKIFTSVMIFQLIEEGRLKLTTPLSRYFPNLPNADKITIANLLNHSSGLYNFTNDSSYAATLSQKVTEAAMLKKFALQKSDFQPGTKHQYSNTNFILLGYIVERLDHKSYSQALKYRILNKIGLRQTYYGGKINISSGEARSYKWQNSWIADTETDMSIPAGAGAVVSTPVELTRFMTALFKGKLINKISLKQMTTIDGGYGMDLVSLNFQDEKGYGHNGGIDGFESQVVYYPQLKLATAYTANGVNTSLNKMMEGVLSIYLNKPFQLPTFTTIQLEPSDLEKYIGSYSSKDVEFKVLFSKAGAQLVAQFSDDKRPLFLEYTAINTFYYDHYDLKFVFDYPSGNLKMITAKKTFLLDKERN